MDMKTSPIATLNDAGLLKTHALIGGEWIAGAGHFDVNDPATGLKLAEVPNLGTPETHDAIAAADKAWPAWRAKTAKERHAVMMKWFSLIMANADDLARILTAEQGKPLAEARGEVVYGASFIEWFAEEAKRVYGETIPTTDNGKRYIVLKQPVGVCAAITPWNFPIAGASPVRRLSTPAGMPARSANSPSASAVSGVSGAGLATTVQPTASAGATLRVIMAAGKFHGVIAATTPIGCLITTMRESARKVGLTSP